jgi:hypothetical protein
MKVKLQVRKGPCYTFGGWIKKLVAYSSIWKCSYADDIIGGGFMMWLSMDIKKQERTTSCKT